VVDQLGRIFSVFMNSLIINGLTHFQKANKGNNKPHESAKGAQKKKGFAKEKRGFAKDSHFIKGW